MASFYHNFDENIVNFAYKFERVAVLSGLLVRLFNAWASRSLRIVQLAPVV
jgi:hypothetical protein